MKKKKFLKVILGCLSAAVLVFIGIGVGTMNAVQSGSTTETANYAVEDYTGSSLMAKNTDAYTTDESTASFDNAMPDAASQNEDPPDTVSESEAASESTDRKLITTVSVSLEIKDAEKYDANLQKLVSKYHGYIESSYVGPDYSNEDAKQYQYTIRIPAESLDAFSKDMSEDGSITDRSVQTQDVTLTYTDMEAHKRALKIEKKTLEDLLSKAETTDDLIKIQTQLTDVRYQLDSLESQLRVYDNQVEYSTINLTVTQVKTYSPVETQSFGEQAKSGIASTLSKMGQHVQSFAIWFVTQLPRLIILAVIAIVTVKAVKFKRRKKSTADKKESTDDKKEN